MNPRQWYSLGFAYDPGPKLLQAGIDKRGKGGHSGTPGSQCQHCKRNMSMTKDGRKCLNINCRKEWMVAA